MLGYLIVVKFLHDNRTEGCTIAALTLAIRRTEGYFPTCMRDLKKHDPVILEFCMILYDHGDPTVVKKLTQAANGKSVKEFLQQLRDSQGTIL